MAPLLDGPVQTARASFALSLAKIREVPNVGRLDWSGAPVTVYDATGFDYATMPIEFAGIVRSYSPDIFTQQMSVELIVDRARMSRPLLTGEFTGGGGLLGDAAKRGTLFPFGFGVCPDCEPVWFDEANNVGMLDGYGNLTSVQAMFEGASDLGASVGDFASYAALIAATIPPGRWGTCIAQGLVRLGAPPAGVITADATFRGSAGTVANRPGTLIRHVLETRAGLPVQDLDTASFAALDVAVPRNVHYWTAQQRDVENLGQAVALSCNATLLVLLNGKIAVTRALGGVSAGTIRRRGMSEPHVTDWKVGERIEPVWRMRARTARPGRKLEYQEVFYEDELEDRGAYNAAETYRQGHLVWLPDGSQWLYINPTPTAGNSPEDIVLPDTSNAYWQRTVEPTSLAGLTYADGTPIENLKPAHAGATRNNPRGAWASGAVYVVGDLFSWEGSVYHVHTPHTASGASPDFS